MPPPSARHTSRSPGAVKIRSRVEHYVSDVMEPGQTKVSDIEHLYRDQGQKLWWALLAYSGNREVASDATAEAFALALRDADAIRDPSPWVWKVAFRIATKELRIARRQEPVVPGAYELDEEAAEVARSLSHLTERQRAIVVLHYYLDLPTEEIGVLLGMSRSTVSVHLHRGRNRLREVLGGSDD